MDDCCRIVSDDDPSKAHDYGLHMVATRDIEPGEPILHESPTVIIRLDSKDLVTQEAAELGTLTRISQDWSAAQLKDVLENVCYPEINDSTKRHQAVQRIIAVVDAFQSSSSSASQKFIREDLIAVLLALQCNAHSIGTRRVVFPTICKVNHACFPNAVFQSSGITTSAGGSASSMNASSSSSFESMEITGTIFAVRRIPKGEQIVIDYLPPHYSFASTLRRRLFLQQSKFFSCQCQRCTAVVDYTRGVRCIAKKDDDTGAICNGTTYRMKGYSAGVCDNCGRDAKPCGTTEDEMSLEEATLGLFEKHTATTEKVLTLSKQILAVLGPKHWTSALLLKVYVEGHTTAQALAMTQASELVEFLGTLHSFVISAGLSHRLITPTLFTLATAVIQSPVEAARRDVELVLLRYLGMHSLDALHLFGPENKSTKSLLQAWNAVHKRALRAAPELHKLHEEIFPDGVLGVSVGAKFTVQHLAVAILLALNENAVQSKENSNDEEVLSDEKGEIDLLLIHQTVVAVETLTTVLCASQGKQSPVLEKVILEMLIGVSDPLRMAILGEFPVKGGRNIVAGSMPDFGKPPLIETEAQRLLGDVVHRALPVFCTLTNTPGMSTTSLPLLDRTASTGSMEKRVQLMSVIRCLATLLHHPELHSARAEQLPKRSESLVATRKAFQNAHKQRLMEWAEDDAMKENLRLISAEVRSYTS